MRYLGQEPRPASDIGARAPEPVSEAAEVVSVV